MRFGGGLGALAERNFRLLWVGQATSAFGDRVAPVALAFAVLELTGSVSDLGYVLAAQVFPMLVFVLLGGVLADRLPRQLVMLGSDLARAAAQALIAALLLLGDCGVWQLVVLSALFGVADAFFTPAAVGLTPLIVSPARLQEANALRALAVSFSGIAGPAIAGVLVAAISPGWALAFDAATFVVSAASLALLRIPSVAEPAARDSIVAELREGWREVRSRQWLSVSIVYWGIFNLTAFPALRVLGPYVAEHSLGGVSAWATILTVGGIGAVAGGLAGLRAKPLRPLRSCILATLLWWPPLLLLALDAPLGVIAGAFLLASIGMGWGNTLWPTILQEHVPARALSRVSAFDYLGTYAVSPLGYLLIGVLAGVSGVDGTLVAAAGVGAVGTLVVLSVPSIRRLERPKPLELPSGAV